MFRPHIGNCVNCPRTNVPIVVRDGFCDKCNYDRKQAKKKAAGKKTGKYTYVRQATGEGELFRELALNTIGDEPTRCFVCGKLVAVVTHNNMAHVLAKGKYPKMRLEPENIRILCFNIQGTGCHSLYDHSPHSELKGEGWERLFELRDRLKEEYKQLED